eukprot:jgi/Chrzof1/811/Cz01g29200.t1
MICPTTVDAEVAAGPPTMKDASKPVTRAGTPADGAASAANDGPLHGDQAAVLGRAMTRFYSGHIDPHTALMMSSDDDEDHEVEVPPESQLVLRRLTTMMKPLTLAWSNLGCTYNTSQGTKIVLQGVYGHAAPGEMVALMGPSGAGKSTLMDILAGRKSVGNLTGEVLVNGAPRGPEFSRKTTYVPQEDNFLPTMTVAETCMYYGTLVLPQKWNGRMRMDRINEVLTAMGLKHTENTLVGGPLPGGIQLRGLSGGERRRLGIAAGIMSTPVIVFLDEPTSGLDSFAALSVMGYMKSMAHLGGHTVIATIHQPRAAIWNMFDTATLLSSGLFMYFGPRDQVVPWFNGQLGYPYSAAMHGVPSDWIMDLVNVGFQKPTKYYGRMMNSKEELKGAAEKFTKWYLEQQEGTRYAGPGAAAADAEDDQLDNIDVDADHAPASSTAHKVQFDDDVPKDVEAGGNRINLHKALATHSRLQKAGTGQGIQGGGRGAGGGGGKQKHSAGANWFTQFRILLWRELLSVTRNPADVAGRMLVFTEIAIFTGLIFYNLEDDINSVRNRMNVLFVEPVIFMLLPYVYMSLYTADKQYFIQDSASKLYHPSAYYVAKQAAILPFAILNVLVYAYTLYGMAGLRNQAAAIVFNGLLSILLYLIAAQVLALAAYITPNQDVAFMVGICWTALNLLLSNYMVRYIDMSQNWLSQLKYISAMGYGFEGYTRAEFEDVTYPCSIPGLFNNTMFDYLPLLLPNANVTYTGQGFNTTVPLADLRTNPLYATILSDQLQIQAEANPNCIVNLGAIVTYFQLFRPMWTTFVILIGYLGVVHVLTYLGLLNLTRKERR